jgi:hypothetical protein
MDESKYEYLINKFSQKNYILRIPFYIAIAYYVFKIHKFPYFMYYKEYNLERRIKEGIMLGSSFFIVNIGFNIFKIINYEKNNE